MAKRKKLADTDDLHRAGLIGPDQLFLYKRVEGISEAEQVLAAYRSAIIDLLRSDVPLSKGTRNLLSNELVALWWPYQGSPQKQRRRDREKAQRAAERELIKYLSETKYKDASDPIMRATQKAAEAFGVTVAALQRRRSRYLKRATD
jgi:hypothetical protein